MARTRKVTQALNLHKYDVLIEDRGARSDYFKITQFDGYFYGGRNAFLIAGATVLKPNSKILVEILNVNGEVVYSAPVANFTEGNSRLIQVEVYEDTPIGPGKLVVLGCTQTYLNGQPVPDTWSDKYNVRWMTDVVISSKIKNKTPIRFINPPVVTVTEKFYPSPETSSFSQSVELVTSDYELQPVNYNIFQNGYLISLLNPSDEQKFKSDYLGGFLNTSITFPTTTEVVNASIPITKIFNSTTAESRGEFLTSSIGTKITTAMISSSATNYTASIQPYGTVVVSSSVGKIKYSKIVDSVNSGSQSSFAKIIVSNLNTISGEVHKVRVSCKPSTEPGEYVIIGEVPTQVQELLSVDSGSKIINVGKFKDINVQQYWYASTMSLAKGEIATTLPDYYYSSSVITNLTPTVTSEILLDSIEAVPEIENNTYKDNVSYFIGSTNDNLIQLFPNSEYTLKFDAVAGKISGSTILNQPNFVMEVYLVKVEDSIESSNLLEDNPAGQLIGTLTYEDRDGRQRFDDVEFNFKPKIIESGTFGLRFVIYGGYWNIANLSVKPAEENFFNPDEINILVPNVHFTNKLLTYKIEYLDLNNNSINISSLSTPTYFKGIIFNVNLNFTGIFTGSLSGTASFAETASYVQGLTRDEVTTVFYVTQEGSDLNDGRTIGTAFRTIKYACQAASTYIAAQPLGSVPRVSIQVKSGYYEEIAPITVPKNTSILGDDLRTVVVRPTSATKTENLFLMNNSTYAWGLRLEGCEIDDLTNPRKGFFFAFAPGAYIVTSPYVQNCTANHAPADKFYVPLDYQNQNPEVGNGPGGMIVDDSVLDGYSPLRSMIVDAYTQVGFNGIGICVRGAGYAQLVSFFTNFSHVGVWCIGGGHASLLNSNTTFGDYGIRASGKRILVVPDITTVSTASDSSAASLITAQKSSIQNYMMTKLQLSGSYSSSYLNTSSSVYLSTIKDSGILIDAISSDLLGEKPGRIAQFTQRLFKGQDVSVGNIYTLPTASGFDTAPIAVFKVNDGLKLANDFIKSWQYIKQYIITDPDAKFGSLSTSIKQKIQDVINIPINTITSVVINNEPTLLQEFGSLATSTSHDFSYAGAGVNFLALPANQGGIGQTNIDIRVFEENGGRVYHTSGDETGDFYTGQDFVIRQATGVIEGRTFNKAIVARFTPLNLVLSD